LCLSIRGNRLACSFSESLISPVRVPQVRVGRVYSLVCTDRHVLAEDLDL
jgi:hypothetical protein